MTIELSAEEVEKRGPEWVREQMKKAGMKLYPHAWRGKTLNTIIVEGVPDA
jgi:hypothetical protein